MPSRAKFYVIVAALLAIVGTAYLVAHRGKSRRLRTGLVKAEGSAPEVERQDVRSPVVLLLLDVSDSLRSHPNREGNDPENREREAAETLIRLVRHFSSPGAGEFAPQVGILTFAATPRWILLNGQRLWKLDNNEAAERAIGEEWRGIACQASPGYAEDKTGKGAAIGVVDDAVTTGRVRSARDSHEVDCELVVSRAKGGVARGEMSESTMSGAAAWKRRPVVTS